MEALVLSVLTIYMLNYIFGRNKNRNIANKWFMDVTPLLEEQFTLVGDDGTSENLRERHMQKETDSIYTIWWVYFFFHLFWSSSFLIREVICTLIGFYFFHITSIIIWASAVLFKNFPCFGFRFFKVFVIVWFSVSVTNLFNTLSI